MRINLPHWIENADASNPQTRKELEEHVKNLTEELEAGGYTKKHYENQDKRELKACKKLLGIS